MTKNPVLRRHEYKHETRILSRGEFVRSCNRTDGLAKCAELLFAQRRQMIGKIHGNVLPARGLKGCRSLHAGWFRELDKRAVGFENVWCCFVFRVPQHSWEFLAYERNHSLACVESFGLHTPLENAHCFILHEALQFPSDDLGGVCMRADQGGYLRG